MAEFPALPLWTDRYFADTRHLTSPEEHGAYILLLMEAWRRPNCSLPDDDALLARLVCCTPARWRKLKPIIMAFWTLDGRSKEWRQNGLMKERSFLLAQRQKQADRAAKRWKGAQIGDAAAEPRQSRGNAPTPTPTPTPREGKKEAIQDKGESVVTRLRAREEDWS